MIEVKDTMKNSQLDARFVEREYINDMLNISCSYNSDNDVIKHDVCSEALSRNELYESDDIECKVFSIAGLDLALPLLSFRETMEKQKILSVNKKSRKAGVCIGGINRENKFIKIADLSFLIMDVENNAEHAGKYEGKWVDVLFINGCSAGIIFDEVIQTQTISHKDVCWRNANSDRTWLAGTVKRYGFSLLDAPEIIHLLNAEC